MEHLSSNFCKYDVRKAMDKNIIKKEKVNEDINYKYKCEECGINFGYSLGDMELHKLTVHLQKGDVEIK